VKAAPGPAYRAEHFTRGYSRELIVDHVGEALSIYHELDGDPELGIPEPIAGAVFSVIQTMVASVEPREGSPAARAVELARSGLALPGGEAARLGLTGKS
jgi:hypothetical protein